MFHFSASFIKYLQNVHGVIKTLEIRVLVLLFEKLNISLVKASKYRGEELQKES